MPQMIITVGSESTMEVNIEDIQRYCSTIAKLPKFMFHRELVEIYEFLETLIELIDAETEDE